MQKKLSKNRHWDYTFVCEIGYNWSCIRFQHMILTNLQSQREVQMSESQQSYIPALIQKNICSRHIFILHFGEERQ